jgi:hypothetical protein
MDEGQLTCAPVLLHAGRHKLLGCQLLFIQWDPMHA